MTMVEKMPKPLWSGWVKTLGLAAAGGVAGYVMASTVLGSLDEGGALAGLEGIGLALLVAAFYVLIGAFVGLAALSPRVGAAVLNVEDADEVREEGAAMRLSGLGCVLYGASLAFFALGGSGGPITPVAAGIAGSTALVLAVVASLAILRTSDELMRTAIKDVATVSFNLLFFSLGTWAGLAHLGLVAGPRMIDILTAFWGVVWPATFWVLWRKGLLASRS